MSSTFVRITDEAAQIVSNEQAHRIKNNLPGTSRKDVASDLILRGALCTENEIERVEKKEEIVA